MFLSEGWSTMDTNVAAPAAPRWRAAITGRRIYVKRKKDTTQGEAQGVSRPLDLLYVVLGRTEDESVYFCVTRPNGQLTFSDSRECWTSAAGTTGQWGTRPASKPGKRCTFTPTAWVAEVSRLIGTERAEEIVRRLSRGSPPL
jgi:hypothetical protein